MWFIVDDQLKVVFGWSAKCGCAHVKKMVLFLWKDELEVENVHCYEKINSGLPKDIENYTVILFIRNPFERLVSGFLDKYHRGGYFDFMWKHEKKTFSLFVDELLKGDYKMVEKHHFTPQTTEKFNKSEIMKSKSLKIFDIKNIDYSYLEKLYLKTIPPSVIQFRGGNEKKLWEPFGPYDKEFVYDVEIDEYFLYKVPFKAFYNTELLQKVDHFYYGDFSFFSEMGFDYSSPL